MSPPDEGKTAQPVPTLFTLVLGTAELGLETLAGRVRTWEGRKPGEDKILDGPAAETDESPPTLSDVAVGLLYRSEEIVAGVTARSRAAVEATGAAAAAAARVVGADRAASSVARTRLPVVGSLNDAIVAIGSMGRERRTQARAMVKGAVIESFDSAVGDVSARVVEVVTQSKEVREVIRIQTTSAGQVVASEIRDVARAADLRLDRGIGRLFRRPAPSVEVLPAGGDV